MDKQIKIMYIEHQRTEADMIEAKLRTAGMQFETSLVYTKEEFISVLEKFGPHLVIVDNYVSALSPEEALGIALKNIMRIPFSLISATVSEFYARDIIKGPASGILKGRVDLIPEPISGSRENEPPVNPESSGNEAPLYNLSILEEMDDNDYVIEIVSIFLNESPKELNEILKGYKSKDPVKLYKHAHKLKGSSGLIQANPLYGVLVKIEEAARQGKIDETLGRLVDNALEQYKKLEAALKKHLTQIRAQA